MSDQPAIPAGAPAHGAHHFPAESWLRTYASNLRASGAIEDDAVERAFATVPRHGFLSQFHHHQRFEISNHGPVPEDVLAVVYEDNPLELKFDEAGRLVSSTTLPSLLARMITALNLTPGMRVLEIGSGIGYNAALTHAVTGSEVVTLEVQPDVVADATAALQRCGIRQVTVVLGDGYGGYPEGSPYDRIIASCGIRGLPPAWFDQLAPNGFVLAPFAHGGAHPLVRFHHRDGQPQGTAVGPWTDFMLAEGSLYQHYPGAHPVRLAEGPYPAVAWRRQIIPPLDWAGYTDLWFYLAAHSPQVTQARLRHLDPCKGAAALLAPDAASVAAIQTDGFLYAMGPGAAPLADCLEALTIDWMDSGCPRIHDWSTPMRRLSLPAGPLFVPTRWSLRPSRRIARAGA